MLIVRSKVTNNPRDFRIASRFLVKIAKNLDIHISATVIILQCELILVHFLRKDADVVEILH